MEHIHLSYKTSNTIQIRIALSQIRNAITTGFRLWSAVKKKNVGYASFVEENQK